MRDRERRHRRAAIMKERCATPRPHRPSSDVHDGLAYALFLPEGEPDVGVVVLHGAGSSKESHFDFARGCRGGRDRGARLRRARPRRVRRQLRTRARSTTRSPWSSCCARMPRGWRCAGRAWAASQAIHAGARDPSICAVVAICPAPEAACCASCARGRSSSSGATPRRAGRGSSRSTWPRRPRSSAPRRRCCSCTRAATSRCPYAVSEQLYEAAHEPKRLLLLPGRPPPLGAARPGAPGRVAQVHPGRGAPGGLTCAY